MGLLNKILNVIGGKEPDIFDDKGNISHKLPKKKWDDWQNRLIQGSEYDWREHKGTLAGDSDKSNPTKK